MRWGGGGLVIHTVYLEVVVYFEGLRLGLHFGSKKLGKISIVFEDLSRNSVFFSNLSEGLVSRWVVLIWRGVMQVML